ncbi:GNAT family N-acetyltransferase [Amnibacterium soli]|uniref:GNAT family N-acetyltransferase n=1 Tax=Amnibacterium soli TaxID=1282736 RepID=A0ABP8Z9I5_9MICO
MTGTGPARYSERVADLHLEPLSAATVVAANSLTLKPGQEQYAVPISHAEAEQTIDPEAAWPRVVLEDGEVVGFIKGSFDPHESRPEFRCCIWSINVAATAQGHGVGRFAVHGLADEARSRGFTRLTVIWERGDAGPEDFFLHVGFRPEGETRFGEVIGALDL